MIRSAIAPLSFLAMSTCALAAGEEGNGGAVSPFAGDVGNAIWTIIIFVLVVVVLGKFAWGPILSALQKREDFIRESLDHAKKDREQAEARLKEYSDKIEAARAEASAIVEEGRRDAEVLKAKIDENAKNEADATLERAKREIELAKDTAIKELYDRTANLATDVASRIIRKEMNAADHERLVAESIAELQSVGSEGNGRS